MLQAKRSMARMMLMLAVAMPSVTSLAQNKDTGPPSSFDPVEFIKGFRIGMSYDEVQGLLPKTAERDVLAYVPSEEAFLLGVDIPGQAKWSASFKFDTLDMPARRPEQLIEFSCSAGLSTRSETF